MNRAYSDKVIVYDKQGEVQDEMTLPEKILHIPGKRGGYGESGLYYKGAGIVYRNHIGNLKEKEEDEHIIGKTGIPYEDSLMCREKLIGKEGIFTFRHQPVFSDLEGGCGKKEKKLIENQRRFEKSAIEEIVDVLPTPIEDHAVYIIRYRKVKGEISDTVSLLEWVLSEGWNTAWDKNLWSDLYAYGYVRDVADWFPSDSPNHKLGTAYALLYSLYGANPELYAQFCISLFGKCSFYRRDILSYSARAVNLLNDRKDILPEADSEENFLTLLRILTSGKACCHLEDDEKYDWVRQYYFQRLSGAFRKNGTVNVVGINKNEDKKE